MLLARHSGGSTVSNIWCQLWWQLFQVELQKSQFSPWDLPTGSWTPLGKAMLRRMDRAVFQQTPVSLSYLLTACLGTFDFYLADCNSVGSYCCIGAWLASSASHDPPAQPLLCHIPIHGQPAVSASELSQWASLTSVRSLSAKVGPSLLLLGV